MMPLVTVRRLRDAPDQEPSWVIPHRASRVSPAISFDCAGGIPKPRRIVRASSSLANEGLPGNVGEQGVRDQWIEMVDGVGELLDSLTEFDDEAVRRKRHGA